jgi:hypothetical protein
MLIRESWKERMWFLLLLEMSWKRRTDRDSLPISANDAMNGLLLCPNCHASAGKKSKKTCIQIQSDGVIHLNGIKDYKGLHLKKVSWNPGYSNYPTAQLLEFALNLPPVNGVPLQELIEEEEDEEEEDAKYNQRKRRRSSNEK